MFWGQPLEAATRVAVFVGSHGPVEQVNGHLGAGTEKHVDTLVGSHGKCVAMQRADGSEIEETYGSVSELYGFRVTFRVGCRTSRQKRSEQQNRG